MNRKRAQRLTLTRVDGCDAELDTPLRSTDSLVSPGDDNVAVLANANEVTETKHNNKNDAAATASGATSACTIPPVSSPVTLIATTMANITQ